MLLLIGIEQLLRTCKALGPIIRTDSPFHGHGVHEELFVSLEIAWASPFRAAQKVLLNRYHCTVHTTGVSTSK
jgi:hypothetical protein